MSQAIDREPEPKVSSFVPWLAAPPAASRS